TAMFAFGTAASHIAFPVGLIGGLADNGGGGFEPHSANPGRDNVLIHLTADLRVEVPGFADELFGDAFAQLPGDELAVGAGQLKPQSSGGVEPPGSGRGRDAAGESDLFGNAPADR